MTGGGPCFTNENETWGSPKFYAADVVKSEYPTVADRGVYLFNFSANL